MGDKRTLILNAAIRLFAKDGVGVPTAKIAKEASVSNGTLFNYFETKQDLLDGACLYVVERMATEILGDVDLSDSVKDMFLCVWIKFVNWANKNPLDDKVLGLLKTSQIVSESVLEEGHNLFAPINDAMGQAVKDKTLLDLPIELMLDIARAHLDATVNYIRENKLKKVEVEGLVRISFDIYWRGISL